MIRYHKDRCGANLIFRLAGTAWPYGVIPGILAVIISIILNYWEPVNDRISKRAEFVSHPYAFQLFGYMLGFLMVFRTNFAYARYMEGIGWVQAMGAKWLDAACMGITFDAGGDDTAHLLYGASQLQSCEPHPTTGQKGGPVHCAFAQDVCHLCSLLHALALMHLRGDNNLNNLGTARDSEGEPYDFVRLGSYATASMNGQVSIKPPSSPSKLILPNFDESYVAEVFKSQRIRVLGGISRQERSALESEYNGSPFGTEARVAMVESWFMRRLIARQKFEQGESHFTSPPILSRLYQVISDGGLWFSHASKVAITPFPFPYHNLIGIMLWTYTFCVPFLVNGLIKNVVARCVVVFMAVFAYHALAKVGDNLEDPYTPYDPNELPLVEIQDSINTRLLMFGCVPPALDVSSESSRPSKTDSQENGNIIEINCSSADLNAANQGIMPMSVDIETAAELAGRGLASQPEPVVLGGSTQNRSQFVLK